LFDQHIEKYAVLQWKYEAHRLFAGHASDCFYP